MGRRAKYLNYNDISKYLKNVKKALDSGKLNDDDLSYLNELIRIRFNYEYLSEKKEVHIKY